MNKLEDSDITENKILAAVGYIGILCFIPLFLKKDSPFAQFHAKQGLILFICWVVTWIIGIFPVIGWIASFAASIALIIISILGFVQALSGKYWKIPLLSQYSEKINL